MKQDGLDNINPEDIQFKSVLTTITILTKKDVKDKIRLALTKVYFPNNNIPQEEKTRIDKLAYDFCEFYNLPEAKKRKPFKPNKRKAIFERSKGICELAGCKNLINESNDIHHKKSEDLGGSRELDNLFMLCKGCHDTISTFQQNKQVELLKLLFIESPKIHIYDFEEEAKIKDKIKEIQSNFFDNFKFKPELAD